VSEFEQNVAGIGALAEPMRRELYLYVCSQPEPVGRDQAADAVGVARHQAKFHLDRLEAEGLLQTEFARLTARTGPGAGRPSKLYRRATHDVAVSLPERQYELAGRLMAEAIAIATHTATPVERALQDVATAYGVAVGRDIATAQADEPIGTDAVEIALHGLARHGYEPRRESDLVVMANCPFHALAKAHTELICQMNHALLTGVAETIAPQRLRASLAPAPGRCCVVLSQLADRGAQ
jgi:predicted ArsR family transcriptional regulator